MLSARDQKLTRNQRLESSRFFPTTQGIRAFPADSASACAAVYGDHAAQGCHRGIAGGFHEKTHRGLDEPNGMPNPSLADYQIKQVVAYLISLQK
jgi:hypothetical protein